MIIKFVASLALMLATIPMAAAPAQASVDVNALEVGKFTPAAGQAICSADQGYAADFGGRRTFVWRPEWLEAIKSDAAAREKVLRDANRALESGLYSVIEKSKLPPGATVHDYASIGPYWWPDPSKPSGLPYIRRDGKVNPERNGPEFDKSRLTAMSDDVRDLALAYYISGNQKYADKAASLLRVWFIDPATRMAPNFNFAQGVPGKVTGRGYGLIEASSFATIVESIGLLQPATNAGSALSVSENAAIEQWYREFSVWMATSGIGAEEMASTNNHGVFFDFYLADFALYSRLPDVAASIVKSFPAQRIAAQMDKQGRFLSELKRTRSWHYANFVVEGATRLASIAECVDRDLWGHRLSDGRGLADAEAFLAQYRDGSAVWPFKDIDLAKKGATKSEFSAARRTALLFGRSEIGEDVSGEKLVEALP
jgi:hypothetical protein